MASRKQSIFLIALGALVLYVTYEYITGEIFVTYRSQDGSMNTEIRNPLSVIFVGRTFEGESSYTSYSVISRITSLTFLMMWGGLVVAAVRHYLGSGSRSTSLRFMLMLFAWTLITKTAATGIHRLWDFYYPDQKIVHPDAKLWLFLLINITQLIVIWFLLTRFLPASQPANSTGEETTEPTPPVKWMRPFHFMTDRMIVFAFAPNLFTTYYLYFKMEMPTGRQFSGESLYLWAIVTTAVSSAVCYLITEKLFQVTPSKILSGTVVTSNGGDRPTWLNVFVRSASRFIPFEPLSFFSGRGWHDRFSGTKVSAVNGSLYVHQNARVIRVIFLIGITFFIYSLVTLAFQIEGDFYDREMLFLTIVIGPCIFLYLAITFTCWVATVSNFAENVGANQSGESSSHFVSALCMWIPLVNFTINSTLFANMASNIHAITKDNKVDRVTRALNRSFLWMYIFIVICLIMLFVSTSWVEIYILMAVAGIVIIIWITQVLRFTRFVSKVKWVRPVVELENSAS